MVGALVAFEKSPVIQGCIGVLYEDMKVQDYGMSFSWDELKEMTGNPSGVKSKQVLYYILSRVNQKLMDYDQKCMVSIHGFGKRIIFPKEHGDVSRQSVKRAAHQYRKAGHILASANMDELSDSEKVSLESDARKWRTLEMFTGELLKRKRLEDKRESRPRNEDIDMLEKFMNLVKQQ